MQLLIIIAFVIVVKLAVHIIRAVYRRLTAPAPVQTVHRSSSRSVSTVSTASAEREAERRRRAEAKQREAVYRIDEARDELVHLAQQRRAALELSELVEAELTEAEQTGTARQIQAARQRVLACDERVRAIDRKISKAHHLIEQREQITGSCLD